MGWTLDDTVRGWYWQGQWPRTARGPGKRVGGTHQRGDGMGIYDRDYIRDQPGPTWRLRDQSVVTLLIIVNVAVFILDMFFVQDREHVLVDAMALRVDSLQHPLEWWKLFTSLFAHSPDSLRHLLWNMFALWVFGRDVEAHYGRAEFLRLYLVFGVVAGLVWALIEMALHGASPQSAIGASGAIAGVEILFALNFPRRTILLFLVLPVQAWVAAILMVIADLAGAGQPASQVAHTAHLAGAGMALAYFLLHMNFGRLLPGGFSLRSLRSKPKLRVHNPPAVESDLSEKVDEILAKISREGEASLTKAERQTLEEASKRYQQRRQ